jgi:hypothetical protein
MQLTSISTWQFPIIRRPKVFTPKTLNFGAANHTSYKKPNNNVVVNLFKQLSNSVRQFFDWLLNIIKFKKHKTSASTQKMHVPDITNRKDDIKINLEKSETASSKSIVLSKDLLAPELNPIWNRLQGCTDKLVSAIGAAAYLLSIAENNEQKSWVPQILCDVLDGRAFVGDKENPFEFWKNNFELACAIRFQERLLGKDFNRPKDAIKIAEKVLKGPHFLWHGTNGNLLNSISRKGLTREWELAPSFEKVKEISERHHLKTLLLPGLWRKGNSIYFIHGFPSASVNYSLRSPEWFYMFCDATRANYNDYALFRNRFERKLIDSKTFSKLSNEEKKDYLQFFEESWNKYGEGKPVLLACGATSSKNYSLNALQAYMKRFKSFSSGRSTESPKDKKQEDASYSPEDIFEALQMLLQSYEEKITDRDIPASSIQAFTLPEQLLKGH